MEKLTDLITAFNYNDQLANYLNLLLTKCIKMNKLLFTGIEDESSFHDCSLINSIISHSIDYGYSVRAGTNQKITINNLVSTGEVREFKKFDYVATTNNYKLVAMNDYKLSSIPLDVCELEVTNEVITKTISIDSNEYYIYLFDDNVSSFYEIKCNGEIINPIVLTSPSYGLLILNSTKDFKTVFNAGDEVTVTYTKSVKTDINLSDLLGEDYEQGIIEDFIEDTKLDHIIISKYIPQESTKELIYQKSLLHYLADDRQYSNTNIKYSILSYFDGKFADINPFIKIVKHANVAKIKIPGNENHYKYQLKLNGVKAGIIGNFYYNSNGQKVPIYYLIIDGVPHEIKSENRYIYGEDELKSPTGSFIKVNDELIEYSDNFRFSKNEKSDSGEFIKINGAYYKLISSNRYNKNEKDSEGDYLKVDGEYYLIESSKRYKDNPSDPEGDYLLIAPGTFVKINTNPTNGNTYNINTYSQNINGPFLKVGQTYVDIIAANRFKKNEKNALGNYLKVNDKEYVEIISTSTAGKESNVYDENPKVSSAGKFLKVNGVYYPISSSNRYIYNERTEFSVTSYLRYKGRYYRICDYEYFKANVQCELAKNTYLKYKDRYYAVGPNKLYFLYAGACKVGWFDDDGTVFIIAKIFHTSDCSDKGTGFRVQRGDAFSGNRISITDYNDYYFKINGTIYNVGEQFALGNLKAICGEQIGSSNSTSGASRTVYVDIQIQLNGKKTHIFVPMGSAKIYKYNMDFMSATDVDVNTIKIGSEFVRLDPNSIYKYNQDIISSSTGGLLLVNNQYIKISDYPQYNYDQDMIKNPVGRYVKSGDRYIKINDSDRYLYGQETIQDNNGPYLNVEGSLVLIESSNRYTTEPEHSETGKYLLHEGSYYKITSSRRYLTAEERVQDNEGKYLLVDDNTYYEIKSTRRYIYNRDWYQVSDGDYLKVDDKYLEINDDTRFIYGSDMVPDINGDYFLYNDEYLVLADYDRYYPNTQSNDGEYLKVNNKYYHLDPDKITNYADVSNCLGYIPCDCQTKQDVIKVICQVGSLIKDSNDKFYSVELITKSNRVSDNSITYKMKLNELPYTVENYPNLVTSEDLSTGEFIINDSSFDLSNYCVTLSNGLVYDYNSLLQSLPVDISSSNNDYEFYISVGSMETLPYTLLVNNKEVYDNITSVESKYYSYYIIYYKLNENIEFTEEDAINYQNLINNPYDAQDIIYRFVPADPVYVRLPIRITYSSNISSVQNRVNDIIRGYEDKIGNPVELNKIVRDIYKVPGVTKVTSLDSLGTINIDYYQYLEVDRSSVSYEYKP